MTFTGWSAYLIGLHDKLDQVLGQVPVLLVEERGGQPEVAHPAGSADAVDVLVDVRREVKVDDVLHVGDVQTASSHLSVNVKKLSIS